MRKLIVAVALAVASLAVNAPEAEAFDIPPAEFVCLAERPSGTPGDWQIIYAEYDQVTTTYVRAACWIVWVGGGPGISCEGYMYLTAAGGTTGGDNNWEC